MPFNRLMTFGNKPKRTDQMEAGVPAESVEPAFESPTAAPDEVPPLTEPSDSIKPAGPFYEKDNQALRIQRSVEANDFWSQYEKSRPNLPFLRYVFDAEIEAVDALLSLRCIHQAEDTGHLICTKPITMGCYRTPDGRYEVFLAGENLDVQTWSEATAKFSSHSGQYRNQVRPDTYERFKGHSQAERIVLQKEYYEITPDETCYYQIFEAPNFVSAKNFLLQPENIITRPGHYIHVVTPKGMFIRDVDGIREPTD